MYSGVTTPCRSTVHLALFDAEGFACRCETVAAIGQHECQRAQIEEVAAELYVVLRLAGRRAFGNQIHRIGVQRSGKAFERAFTVDVLDRDARPVLVDPALAVARLRNPIAPGKNRRQSDRARCRNRQASRDRSNGRLKPTIRPRP